MKLTKSLVKKGGKKSLKKSLKMQKSKKGGKKSLNTKKARKSVKHNKNKSLKKLKEGGSSVVEMIDKTVDHYYCDESNEQRGHTKGNTSAGYKKFFGNPLANPRINPTIDQNAYAGQYEGFKVGETSPKLKNTNLSQRSPNPGNSYYSVKNIQMGAQEAPLGVECLKVKKGTNLQALLMEDS